MTEGQSKPVCFKVLNPGVLTGVLKVSRGHCARQDQRGLPQEVGSESRWGQGWKVAEGWGAAMEREERA